MTTLAQKALRYMLFLDSLLEPLEDCMEFVSDTRERYRSLKQRFVKAQKRYYRLMGRS